jgi:hypothetical protein
VGWRFRPADRMVAHTGFLIFARRLLEPPAPEEGTFPAAPEEESLEISSGIQP